MSGLVDKENVGYTHTMEYYSAVKKKKKNEILPLQHHR